MVNKIGEGAGVRNATPTKKAKGASASSGFADNLTSVGGPAGTDPEIGQTVAASGMAGVGAVLAAQDVGDSLDGRSKGLLLARGDKLLDHLDDLRLAVLQGRVSKDSLIRLAQDVREKRPNVEDPMLNEIIDEIEMRAEVELAKLTR